MRFTKKEVYVSHKGFIILKGKRHYEKCLQLVLIKSTKNSQNTKRAVTKRKKISSSRNRIYARKERTSNIPLCFCFYPIKIMWIVAIKNVNRATFPGLKSSIANQQLPLDIPTTQGRQCQRTHGIRLTIERVEVVIVSLEQAVHEACSKCFHFSRLT